MRITVASPTSSTSSSGGGGGRPDIRPLTAEEKLRQQSIASPLELAASRASSSKTVSSGSRTGGGGSSSSPSPSSSGSSGSLSTSQKMVASSSTQPTTSTSNNLSQSQLSIVVSDRPDSMVSAAPKPQGIFEKARAKISQSRARLSTQEFRGEGNSISRGAARTGLGVASFAVGTVEFVAKPIKSIKDIATGVKAISTEPVVRQQVREDVSRTLREEPSFAVGAAAGALVTSKGIGAAATYAKGISTSKFPTLFLASQKTVNQATISKAFFRLPTGEVGIAKAASLVGKSGKIAATGVVGKFGRVGFQVPRARLGIKNPKTFGTSEVSSFEKLKIVKQTDEVAGVKVLQELQGDVKASVGFGQVVVEGKPPKNFIGTGLDIKRGDKTAAFSAVSTEGKVRDVRGLVLEESSSTSISSGTTGTVQKTVPDVKQTLYKSIGALASTKVPTPKLAPKFVPPTTLSLPERTLPTGIKTVSAVGTTTPLEKPFVQDVKEVTVSAPPQSSTKITTTTKQVPLSNQRRAQGTSQSSQSIQTQRITQSQSQAQEQVPIQRITQSQAQSLRQKQIIKPVLVSQPARFAPIIPKVFGFPIFRRPKKQFQKPTTSRGGFGVQVRRFGKFQTIGTGLSLRQAQQLGRQRVTSTLGATYRLRGQSINNLSTPKGFKKKKTKEGILFIEQPKYRLSKKGEKVEIQEAKRRKKK